MITYQRCKEIFSDNEKFEKIMYDHTKFGFSRVYMKRKAKDGYHYDFSFRKKPNGINDVAEIIFGKWTTTDTKVVFDRIYDENSLLNLIDVCHNQGAI